MLPLIMPEYFTGIRKPFKVRGQQRGGLVLDLVWGKHQAHEIREYITGIRKPFKVGGRMNERAGGRVGGRAEEDISARQTPCSFMFTVRSNHTLFRHSPLCQSPLPSLPTPTPPSLPYLPGSAALRPPRHRKDHAGKGSGDRNQLHLFQRDQRHTRLKVPRRVGEAGERRRVRV